MTFISVVLPFFVLLFLNVYKNERIAALSELAASLGANSRQILWRISFNNIKLGVVGSNLLLFTENPHFDPELNAIQGRNITYVAASVEFE